MRMTKASCVALESSQNLLWDKSRHLERTDTVFWHIIAHNHQFLQGKVIKKCLPVMLHYEFQKLERLPHLMYANQYSLFYNVLVVSLHHFRVCWNYVPAAGKPSFIHFIMQTFGEWDKFESLKHWTSVTLSLCFPPAVSLQCVSFSFLLLLLHRDNFQPVSLPRFITEPHH